MTKEIEPLSINKWREYWRKNIQERLNIPPEAVLAENGKSGYDLIPELDSRFTLGKAFAIVIDNVQHKYIHAQGDVDLLLGIPAGRLVEGNVELAYSLLHPFDKERVAAASIYYDQFIYQQPIEKRGNIKTSISLRMQASNGKYLRFLEQLIPLNTNQHGVITHTLKHFTDISQLPFTDDIVLSFMDISTADVIHSVMVTPEIKQTNGSIFSKRELEILKLITNGLTSKQIADKLCVSVDTINNHRKNMLRKAGAKNIPEVLNMAFAFQLLK